MHTKAARRLRIDLYIIAGSVAAAVFLLSVGAFDGALSLAREWGALGCFIAGVFFTSMFTVGPASVALVALGHSFPPVTVALWGALGALCGDLVIFYFLRDRVADDMARALRGTLAHKKVLSFFHLGFVKILAPLLGALIIASPLPDELGLAMMGLSHTRAIFVVPVSFVMNFLGILALVSVAGLW